MKSIIDKDGYMQSTIPPGAYEIESFNNEIKQIFLMKNITPNQIIHLQSNEFFRNWDLSQRYPLNDQTLHSNPTIVNEIF